MWKCQYATKGYSDTTHSLSLTLIHTLSLALSLSLPTTVNYSARGLNRSSTVHRTHMTHTALKAACTYKHILTVYQWMVSQPVWTSVACGKCFFFLATTCCLKVPSIQYFPSSILSLCRDLRYMCNDLHSLSTYESSLTNQQRHCLLVRVLTLMSKQYCKLENENVSIPILT